MIKTIFSILLSCSVIIGYSQNDALFELGKERYKAEKYQEAITQWMKILEAGEHSTAVYYNLGNAHYKLNNIGPSIYYYEKALKLSPNDSEVLNNLAFANNATIDIIEPLPKTIFAKWDTAISGLLDYEGWAWLSVMAMMLFSVLFLSYYYVGVSSKKRLLFVASMLAILIFITSIVMSFRVYERQLNDRPAIIFAESTEIKNEPNMGSETTFVLHEGTKVQLLETEDNWVRIVIADGKEGWMPSSDLKEL